MTIVVSAAALIDGTGREPLRKPRVVIEGGRFRQILAGDDPAVPSDAELIDVGDATLLPGLIDSHDHLVNREELGSPRIQIRDPDHEIAFRIARSAREHIESGVTSIRTVGDKNFLDMTAKKYIDTGYIPGPRVYPAGAGIRSTHGHGANATTIADGVEAVRKAVREHVFRGSRHIKLFITGGLERDHVVDTRLPHYTREEVRVAIEESHNVGKKIVGHIHGGPSADWALEFGLDTLEHGPYLTEQQLVRMAGSGMWLVPTMIVYGQPDPVPDTRPPAIAAHRRRTRESCLAMARTAIQAGVKIAAGCDAYRHLWREMELLVEAGMSPMEALVAATRKGAELLGELDQIGTVEEGKLADLIALKDDPLQDIRNVKNVCLVLKEGVRFV